MVMSPIGDVQYHVNLSTKATVQNKTTKEDKNHSSPTRREQVKDTTHIGASMARKTAIEEAFNNTQDSERGQRTSHSNWRFEDS